MDNMHVLYDRQKHLFTLKHKLSNGQTMEMCFDLWFEDDFARKKDLPIYFVSLVVYSKRKDKWAARTWHKSTGKNPFESAQVARSAFHTLEMCVAAHHPDGFRVYVGWEDNRRRDAYEKVLSRKGYVFQNCEGFKVLAKTYLPDECSELVKEHEERLEEDKWL